MSLKITILGTGTSQGVPVIGCPCPVCASQDPRDKRLRTAAIVHDDRHHILIDIGPDFRRQMLDNGLSKVDAVLLTHEHNDHIIGLDDIRPINFAQQKKMPIFGLDRVLNELKLRFSYVFDANPYPGVPGITINPITKDSIFSFGTIRIQAFGVRHGQLPILGFRLNDLVYITDANKITPETIQKIKNCKILIINALHHKKHHSHFNLEESLAMIEKINPDQAFLTHISHHMGLHETIDSMLPPSVSLAYDGLELSV